MQPGILSPVLLGLVGKMEQEKLCSNGGRRTDVVAVRRQEIWTELENNLPTDWLKGSKTASIELLLSEWEKQEKDQMELLSWHRGWCNWHVLCPSVRVLCSRCRCEVNIRKNVGKHGPSKILISLLYISNPRKSLLDFICSGSDLLKKKKKPKKTQLQNKNFKNNWGFYFVFFVSFYFVIL